MLELQTNAVNIFVRFEADSDVKSCKLLFLSHQTTTHQEPELVGSCRQNEGDTKVSPAEAFINKTSVYAR